MKYNANNRPLVCMQTNSTCYKGTKKMNVKGILWHSTGANNAALKRYVQPSDDASDKAKMIELLGKNTYGNDWNHITRQAGLNAWIGKLADGSVATVQTMPWDYRPWGCGSGSKGSCNDNFIQFEMCEDALTDKSYFDKVYQEACELTAYLCDMYNLNPNGTVSYNGIKVPVILCHYDSYKLGLGSNHSDVYHWFNKYGKTMEDVRKDVTKIMNSNNLSSIPASSSSSASLKVGDVVKLVSGAKYTSGKTIPDWLYKTTLYVREIRNDSVVISTQKTGAITGVVEFKYLIKGNSTMFSPYMVKVTVNNLNIRSGAGTNYSVCGVIKDNGVYTIVDEKINGSTKWGLLSSGKGWISLKYTKRV